MFQAKVFTLYPEVFPGPLSKGLYGKALSNKLWELKVINIRDAATDKHKTVDDSPYGGGTGMLLKADILTNPDQKNIKIGKAGRSRWLGRRPHTRGVVKNPVDHPHGGGEGKTAGGRHPVSPTGQSAKGLKTRDNKRTDKFIVKRRNKRKDTK